jgi:hypothetical protein
MTRKRGSIALARQLCYEIAGATSGDDDISGSDYGSVDVAEILSAEVERLREALAQPEQQAEPCVGKDPRCPCQDGDACHYKDCGGTNALPVPVAQPEQEPVNHAIIAGALFDFLGWLTSRKERLALSRVDDASPAVNAITDFAKMRGLSLDDARVQDWHIAPPAAQRPWQGLTDEDWKKVANRKNTVLDTFEQGAVWAAYKLERRNT